MTSWRIFPESQDVPGVIGSGTGLGVAPVSPLTFRRDEVRVRIQTSSTPLPILDEVQRLTWATKPLQPRQPLERFRQADNIAPPSHFAGEREWLSLGSTHTPRFRADRFKQLPSPWHPQGSPGEPRIMRWETGGAKLPEADRFRAQPNPEDTPPAWVLDVPYWTSAMPEGVQFRHSEERARSCVDAGAMLWNAVATKSLAFPAGWFSSPGLVRQEERWVAAPSGEVVALPELITLSPFVFDAAATRLRPVRFRPAPDSEPPWRGMGILGVSGPYWVANAGVYCAGAVVAGCSDG